jgi:threonine dehydrogenase-like Zn-dependent dehydrogenase
MITMQATVFHGVNDIRVESVPAPSAGPGESVPRITATTICGTDLLEVFLKITDGGVDLAIEALGTLETFESCLRCLRPGGTLSSAGVYSGKLQIPHEAYAAGLGDHRIVTTLCSGGNERMRRLINVVQSGRFDPRMLITHRFSLADIKEGYEVFGNRDSGVLKVLITP